MFDPFLCVTAIPKGFLSHARYESFYSATPDGPSSPGATSKLITPEAFQRVKGLLKGTKGTIVIGGKNDEATKFIAPTVVSDVRGDDPLMKEWVTCISFPGIYSLRDSVFAGKFLDQYCPLFRWRIWMRLSTS